MAAIRALARSATGCRWAMVAPPACRAGAKASHERERLHAMPPAASRRCPAMRPVVIRLPLVLAAALWAAHPAAAAPPAPRPASAAPLAPVAASAPSPVLTDACPAQLPVKQTVTDPIAGWTPLNQQGNYPFTRVAFYPGPPAESSLIVPTIEFKGQAGLHDGWELPRRASGYWMTCAYANTTATLSRKLADDVDFCMADYDGRFMTLVVKRWSCGPRRTMAPPVWARPSAKKQAGKRGG